MKKSTITALAVVMGVSFASLLLMQLTYIEEIISIRKRHFEESVYRSLYRTAHQLEVQETMYYLEQSAGAIENVPTLAADTTKRASAHSNFGLVDNFEPMTSKKYFTKKRGKTLPDVSRSLQDIIREKFLHEKSLLNEVIYRILYTASDRPLEQRIDFAFLDQTLKAELHYHGIDMPYHFVVTTGSGREVFRCSDYDAAGEQDSYTVPLFRNDPESKMARLTVHFPDMEKFIHSSLWYILPSMLFTLVLLVTFVVTLVLVFRQKKLTEVKNDFINNMTHEFKTPISSISLAAQMLGDESLNKSPQMFKRLSSTIIDETKRLRFQVEKVLQLSMYENQKANLKMKEVNANELISGVVHTFGLKVEKNGGKIITELNAEDPLVMVDDMHFTNVIFNLMDNAVKYRRTDSPLELKLTTWNENKRLCISIQDNGIGIKKDDLKKIFDKFYRVHTGNLHDVKGFGLGLAYVKKIVLDHKGVIYAESELGIGTKFIIKLPIID